MKSFNVVLDQLSVADTEDGPLLLKGTRLVIPVELVSKVIESANQSHQGIVKIKGRHREIVVNKWTN